MDGGVGGCRFMGLVLLGLGWAFGRGSGFSLNEAGFWRREGVRWLSRRQQLSSS